MPSVVGREEELRAAETFLANLGGVAALVVVGEPGIGKTTVWEAAVDLAVSGDSTVLAARPAESEAKLSFAGLSDLLSTVPDDVFSLLPQPQRDALDAALLRSSPARTPDRRAVGAGFLSVLRALAADGPVVLAIDDLQWLDSPTTAVVDFALRRLRAEPVRTVVTTRSGTAGGLLATLERELGATRIELSPMSVAALHRIVADTIGHHFPRPTIVRIAEACGGNPFYALEIARELVDAGAGEGRRLPIPRDLDPLVRKRVGALPAGTRDALLRAAALARPTTDTIDASALTAAEQAGLIRIEGDGRIHFGHPLIASAVYSSAPLAHRRATHRALAAVVGDPEERARHLALAAERGDPRLLAELADAARAARARGAPDSAAELTELALRFTAPRSAEAQRLQLELAEHLYLASDFQRATAALEKLRAAVEPGDLRARVLILLADIDYWRSGESVALELAEQALVDARDPLTQARCHVAIAMYAGTVDLAKAAANGRAAVALLEPLAEADSGLLAAALGAMVRAELFLGNGFEAETATRALALEESAPLAAVDTRIVFKLGQWLRYVDDFEGARAQVEQAERQARDEGDDSSLANILLNRVILATWAGAIAEATELAERMIDAFAQLGLETSGPNVWKTYVDAYAGRIDTVRTAAAGADTQEPIVAALWERAIGLAELAAGEIGAADRHLSRALSEFDRIDFREPAIWRVDGDAIEAAAAVGDLERAERWLARFEERAARSQIPWSLAVSARCRGLVLAGQGTLEPAADALGRALKEHERCPMPFEHARTLLAHGQVLRRLKRKREARTSLEAAAAMFEGLGTELWVAHAESELRRVAARRAPSELTATERRIAELAASGLSNPEIAGRVFVSRKTVESNLARVYRKLGISSRGRLEEALRKDGVSIP